MKKLCVMVIVATFMTGCIPMGSIRNTTNRLQGDIEYFEQEIDRYSILISKKEASKAENVLKDAKDMLSKAHSASLIGDKLSKKKYLSALVDIMDLLEIE